MRFWKIVLTLYLQLLLIGSTFLLATPVSVSAAPATSATWVDVAHVTYDNGDGNGAATYYDKRTDSDYTFVRQTGAACHDTIHIDNLNSKTAKYQQIINSATSGCHNAGPAVTLTLTGGGSNLGFNWVNLTTIQTSDCDGGSDCHTFTSGQAAAAPNQYVQDSSDCKSSITAIPPTTTQAPGSVWTGTFVAEHKYSRFDGTDLARDATLRSSWSGYPFQAQIHYSGHQEGPCLVADPITVEIGKADLATVVGPTPTTGPHTPSGGIKCDVGNFSWIFCPMISAANAAANFFKSIILSLLVTSPLDGGIQGVMNKVIQLADVIFVLIFLVIIASTTLSIGLTNYSIKKMLPRFIIAVIAVQFSFPLMQLAVDLTNIVGGGINSLILAAGPQIAGAPDGSVLHFEGFAAALLGVTLVTLALGPEILLAVLLALAGIMIGLVTLFVTLFVRTILIQLLAIIAPLAIVAWVLPNTQVWYKKWWQSFTKMLLMYPIIAGLFALATVVSRLPNAITDAAKTGGANPAIGASPSGATTSTFGMIATSLAPMAALFMAAGAAKAGGAAMGWAGGAISGVGARLKKKASGEQLKKDLKQDRKEKNAIRSMQTDNKAVRAFSRLRAGGGINPFSATAQRRVAGIADKAEQAKIKDSHRVLKDKDAKDVLAELAKGNNAGGIKADIYARIAAIDILGAEGKDQLLREVKEKLGGENMTDPTKKRIWKDGLAPNYSKVKERAPDITSGAEAFDKVTAKQISMFDGDGNTAEVMMKRLAQHRETLRTDPTNVAALAALKNAKNALEGVAKTAGLRNEVKPGTGQVILGSLGGPNGVAYAGSPLHGAEKLIEVNGNFVEPTPPAPTPPTPPSNPFPSAPAGGIT